MASIISHLAVPISIRIGSGKRKTSNGLLLLSAVLSMLPDIDVLAFKFQIPYESQWGHRGFSHSIAFALAVAVMVMPFSRYLNSTKKWTFLVCFIATASHGLLDAMTNGGLGVNFFWPINLERHFLPWQVIEVSPIGIDRFFTQRGWVIFRSELLYVWFPFLAMGLSVKLLKKTGLGSNDPIAGQRPG